MTAPTTVLVSPTSGVLQIPNLKSLENWRAFLHQATPVVVTVLTTLGVVSGNQAALWVPLLFAVFDPLLSVMNTTDKVRKIIYGVVGLLQSAGLITGLATGLGSAGGQVAPVIGAGLTVLSAFLARFYTPTTTVVPTTGLPTNPFNEFTPEPVQPELPLEPQKKKRRRLP